MRVAHLSQTDAGAGAGRAARRIHRSLLAMGVDSCMIVGEKRTTDATILPAFRSPASRFIARICQYFEAKASRQGLAAQHYFFSPARFGYFKPAHHRHVQAADVLCLYWINGGFITPEALRALSKPIIWRLSDVWPFTGGCHYPGNCERFTVQCGHCPQLANPAEQDRSRQLWQRKAAAWKDVNLTIVAPSQWIADLARKSALFAHRRMEVVPTGVDTDLFAPKDRIHARARLGIPADKHIILFGAASATDPRKGFSHLQHALRILAQRPDAHNIMLVTFGRFAEAIDALPLPSIHIGQIDDDDTLANAYSAADLVVVPSQEDNLPNVALEAIACGVPVVGFDVCGMNEIIRHQWNGYLADTLDAEKLAGGMAWVLGDEARRMQLKENARTWAAERFNLKTQAERYYDLCSQLAGKP